MVSCKRSSSVPADFHSTTARSQPLVDSSVPRIHHQPTGQRIGIPGHDSVDGSEPVALLDQTGGVQIICLRCLKWSLSNSSNARIPFNPETKIEIRQNGYEWGFPFQMKDSPCALCRLFALHSYDYGPNPMHYRVFDLHEITCQSNHASFKSSDYFASKASFWYLDPGDRPRANFPMLIGPGACIGKVNLTSPGNDDPVPSTYDSESASSSFETLMPVQVDACSIDFERLERWIELCKHRHGASCDPSTSDALPDLTLIDCMAVPPRLLAGKSHHKYAALSYVWGIGGTTGAYEVGDMLNESTIPRTIKDAMTVARKLDLYLWVDRYCISQDPQRKQEQIARMDVVYGGSEITIVAVAGADIEYGLPGIGTRSRVQQPYVRVGNDVFLSIFGDVGMTMQQSEWGQRAWCYQEALLPRRRLVFTQGQVYFHCRRMACVEVLSHSYEEPSLMPQARVGVTTEQFYNSLQVLDIHNLNQSTIKDIFFQYTGKQMSYQSDALNAAAGIFRALSNTNTTNRFSCYGGLMIFGYPSTTQFVYSLFWGPFIGQGRRQPELFPSWSWTGWSGMMRLPDWEAKTIDGIDKSICLRLIAEDNTTVAWDDFVESGRLLDSVFPLSKFIQLHVLTSWVTVTWIGSRVWQFGGKYLVALQHHSNEGVRYAEIHTNHDISQTGKMYAELHDEVIGRPMKYVALKPYDTGTKTAGMGLLLRPVEDYYERIGTIVTDFVGSVRDGNGNEMFFQMSTDPESKIEGFDFKREWIRLG